MFSPGLKRVTMFICALFFQGTGAFAQNSGDFEIDFSYEDTPLLEAINQLINNHQAPIMFQARTLKKKRVNANCEGCSLDEALERLIGDQSLSWRKLDGQYIITRQRRKPGRIHGLVVFKSSQRPVPQLQLVLEPRSPRATQSRSVLTSSEEGAFDFHNVKPGHYSVSIVSEHFSNQSVEDIELPTHGKDAFVKIEVEALDMAPQNMIVRKNLDGFTRQLGQGVMFEQRASGMGYQSPGSLSLNSLSRFPGISAHDWASSEVRIKGSGPRETAVYLDGALIESPVHFQTSEMSAREMIDGDAIGSMKLFSGGLPIEYGDRMGGVLAMTSQVPTRKLETSVSLSTLESKARTAGTFHDGRGSWFLNLRRGYWDFVDRFRREPRRAGAERDANNEDLMAKVQYFFNDTHIFSVHMLQGRNRYSYSDINKSGGVESRDEGTTDSNEESQYAWINLKSFWTSNLWSETVITSGAYKSDFEALSQLPGIYERSITDHRDYESLSIRQDWGLDRNIHRIKWGFQFKEATGDFDFEDEAIFQSGDLKRRASVGKIDLEESEGGVTAGGYPADFGEPRHSLDEEVGASSKELGFYVGDRVNFSKKLVGEFAMRYDQQSHVGDHQWSPRVHFTYRQNPNTIANLSWGRFYQSHAIHQLEIRDGVTSYSPAELSEQFVASLDLRFKPGLWLKSEVYDKQYSSMRARYLEFNSGFRDRIAYASGSPVLEASDGLAKGFTLTLQQEEKEGVSWMLNYTLSRAEDLIEGQYIPRYWDQRHAVNAMLNYNYRNRHDFSIAYKWHSGRPTTNVSLDPLALESGEVRYRLNYGELNGARLPQYHRLDVRIDNQISLGKNRSFYWYAEIANLLNHDNINGYTHGIKVSPDGQPFLVSDPVNSDSILPTIGLRWDF